MQQDEFPTVVEVAQDEFPTVYHVHSSPARDYQMASLAQKPEEKLLASCRY